MALARSVQDSSPKNAFRAKILILPFAEQLYQFLAVLAARRRITTSIFVPQRGPPSSFSLFPPRHTFPLVSGRSKASKVQKSKPTA